MKKFYKIAATFLVVASSNFSFAQTEFRSFTQLASGIFSVNDLGNAVTNTRTYNYATNTFTPKETTTANYNTINNKGDIAGAIYMENSTTLKQPGVKLAGSSRWDRISWFPNSNPANSSFEVYKISTSGQYVVGNMSEASTVYGAFLYDTISQVFTPIILDSTSPYRYIRIMGVNDNGIMTGWADYKTNNPSGVRTPIYINKADMIIHEISINGSQNINNIAYAINNNNVIAGYKEGYAFTYNINTDEVVMPQLPDGLAMSFFLGISDDGIAVGYGVVQPGTYDAIVYKPGWDKPKLIKDILAAQNIQAPESLMGTANAISNNGKYIGGYYNGGSTSAKGWMLKLDEKTLATSNVKKADIKIYPNPTSDYFSIQNQSNKIDAVEIYSIDGRLAKKFNIHLEKYDISKLPAGNYMLKIISNTKTTVNQLIKK